MQLSRKQVILISAVSILILLLTLAAVLIFTPGDGEASAEPAADPEETAQPMDAPTPAPTLAPTVFRLPLVPQFDTPQPSPDPAGIVDGGMGQHASWPNAALPGEKKRIL